MYFGQKGTDPVTVANERLSSEERWTKYATISDPQHDNPPAENPLQSGELSLEEDVAGGLGRHLGLFSTTFLMYFNSPSLRV